MGAMFSIYNENIRKVNVLMSICGSPKQKKQKRSKNGLPFSIWYSAEWKPDGLWQ
jgi:hypothetical protein